MTDIDTRRRRIREMLAGLDMTQGDLAQELGLNAGTLSLMLNGERIERDLDAVERHLETRYNQQVSKEAIP